jgi:hypothetical protein
MTLKGQIERKLSNLYKLAKEAEDDPNRARDGHSLSKRMRNLQDELDAITVKLDGLKVSVAFPPRLLDRVDLTSFASRMPAVLTDPSTEDARTFLRPFVGEIRVYANQATISRPNLSVVEAAVTSSGAAGASVPTFTYNWRKV